MLKLNFWPFAFREPMTDSAKARKVVADAYKTAGSRPSPGLVRLYGEYLDYKRNKLPIHPASEKKGDQANEC